MKLPPPKKTCRRPYQRFDRSFETLKRTGFTLIELLVVISIIGILASFAIASFTSAQAKGRDASRKNDFHAIKIALQMYYDDHGASYPNPVVNPAWGWTGSPESTWLQDLTNAGYIKVAPKDPRNADTTAEFNYYYRANMSGGSDYCFMHALESAPTTTDPNYVGYWNNTHKYFFGPDGGKNGYECTH